MTADHLAANVRAPAPVLRAAALTVMGPGSMIAAFTGVVAQSPQEGMADHSVSRAELSVWRGAVRREAPASGIQVMEARPGHLYPGFADRPVAGTAPPMPVRGGAHRVVVTLADGMRADAELPLTASDGAPVVERRAR
ncbi:hypothetical protein ACF05L_36805 [Streptomyces bobili]|uniref:hypothetical protein n=1 Tax=Streptomyces bobili TaxID=67280 RepID=UPI0036FA8F1B